MNTCIQRLKRIGNRIKRFRYRKGFGVHSPFAFRLITEVIYESYSFYKYSDLKSSKVESTYGKGENLSIKVLKLIFRLINWFQPKNVIDIGPNRSLELVAGLAKEGIEYFFVENYSKLADIKANSIDFVFLHYCKEREIGMQNELEILMNLVHSKSLLIISGICYSKEMKIIWNKIQNDSRVGITFDLYDLGLVFFDLEMNKQDYIVNF